MTRGDAEAFAAAWAAAWNERDVERVLGWFTEQTTFTSPTAVAVTGIATLRGKDALRAYWIKALGRINTLRFTVDRVVWDPATLELGIIYVAEMDARRRRVSENLTFGADGRVVSAEVFHGVEQG